MNVIAGVAQFGDLLGEQLHALCWIAENDGLVDAQLQIERKKLTNKNDWIESDGTWLHELSMRTFKFKLQLFEEN